MLNNSLVGEVIRFDKCINGEKLLNAATADIILEANPDRTYGAIINNSSAEVTLVFAGKDKAFLGKGIILKPRGGSYEINSNNLYVGKISAISATTAKLCYVECS